MAKSDAQPEKPTQERRLILLTGATGYIGSRLLPLLEQRALRVRCLARKPDKLRTQVVESTEIVEGDMLDRPSLDTALAGVRTAYYLVHLMSSSAISRSRTGRPPSISGLPPKKRVFSGSFLWVAWKRNLTPSCRLICAAATKSAKSYVTPAWKLSIRASVVIGKGSLSYTLIRSLTDRLPVMICPRWLATPTQPIAVKDVSAYLLAALDLRPGESQVFEIGSSDVTTYGQLIQEYARQRGLRRWLISVPLLTPYLSGLWLALVTPATYKLWCGGSPRSSSCNCAHLESDKVVLGAGLGHINVALPQVPCC